MSSEVQAKCTKPATRAASGLPARRCFSQYSIALTSWLVSASIALTCAASSSENAAMRRSSACIGVLRERLDLGDRRFAGEREQPADLDRDAVAEERGFAEAGT